VVGATEFEEMAQQRGLAGAHLADQAQEALALLYAIGEGSDRLLDGGIAIEEARVRGVPERGSRNP